MLMAPKEESDLVLPPLWTHLDASGFQDLKHSGAAQPECGRHPPAAHACRVVLNHLGSECVGNPASLWYW